MSAELMTLDHPLAVRRACQSLRLENAVLAHRAALRLVVAISQESLPCTSLHALHHHRRSAASHSQAVRTQQVIKAVPTSASGPASSKMTFQASRQRPLGTIWHTKMSLLSTAQNFHPLRGADRMAPCGAGNLLDGEARAQKWLEKCAGAESTRLVALVPKIKVRCANTAGNTGVAGCR